MKNRLKGLGKTGAEADDDAIKHIARVAGGDLRTAYNALEQCRKLLAGKQAEPTD